MAVNIKENKDVFVLQGKINSSTIDYLISRFKYLLIVNKKLTIDIDHVTEIDETGIKSLLQTYVYAQLNNYQFSIVGLGCKEIYDEFRYQNVA